MNDCLRQEGININKEYTNYYNKVRATALKGNKRSIDTDPVTTEPVQRIPLAMQGKKGREKISGVEQMIERERQRWSVQEMVLELLSNFPVGLPGSEIMKRVLSKRGVKQKKRATKRKTVSNSRDSFVWDTKVSFRKRVTQTRTHAYTRDTRRPAKSDYEFFCGRRL